MGWYWVELLRGNIIPYLQVQITHIGLVRIWTRLIMDKPLGLKKYAYRFQHIFYNTQKPLMSQFGGAIFPTRIPW